MKRVETARLIWIPWTPETMDAFIEGHPEVAAQIWNAAVPADFPNDDYREGLLSFRRELTTSRAGIDGVIIEQDLQTAIGTMGFRPPAAAFKTQGILRNRPALEIGFGLLAAYWNRGYATEMAQALVRHVLEAEAAQVVAECEQDNAASARVLDKAGFCQVGRAGSLLLWDYGGPAAV